MKAIVAVAGLRHCGLLVIVVGAPCLCLAAWYHLLGPGASYRATRAASVASLAAATSFEELDKATEGLGVRLSLPDGSWIAIRYWDSHSLTNFYSSAVALCSDGSWFECDRHFCGAFFLYQQRKQFVAQMNAGSRVTPGQQASEPATFSGEPARTLQQIERAPSLDRAKELLQTLDFTPIRTTARSNMPGAAGAR